MRLSIVAVAFTLNLIISCVAHANVVGSLGGGTGPFLSLSGAGLENGSVATLTGGTVDSTGQPIAAMPAGADFGGTFRWYEFWKLGDTHVRNSVELPKFSVGLPRYIQ